jgi:pimeloyl-ACP methyl ester carboxylesterase
VHDPRWLGEPPERAAYDPATDSAYRAAAARMLREFDFAALRERFGELRQPTLLIWGEDDPTIPLAVGQRIASLLPCGRLITMANTLHRPHQVHPEATVQAIETFLAARSPCGPATISREPTRPQ